MQGHGASLKQHGKPLYGMLNIQSSMLCAIAKLTGGSVADACVYQEAVSSS